MNDRTPTHPNGASVPSAEGVRVAREWVTEWDSLTDDERAERDMALAQAICEATASAEVGESRG